MMTWECACGITNSSDRDICAGCGWTHEHSNQYKNGKVHTPDKKEMILLAQKTYEKEMSFFRRGAFAALVVGLISAATFFYFKIDYESGLFDIIATIIFLCIVIGIACVKGLIFTDRQYDLAIEVRDDQQEPKNIPEKTEISSHKITPTSGLNLKRRIVGLLFGASIPIILVLDTINSSNMLERYLGFWKYVLYVVLAFGLVGFIFGDKYYDQIMKYFRNIRKN